MSLNWRKSWEKKLYFISSTPNTVLFDQAPLTPYQNHHVDPRSLLMDGSGLWKTWIRMGEKTQIRNTGYNYTYSISGMPAIRYNYFLVCQLSATIIPIPFPVHQLSAKIIFRATNHPLKPAANHPLKLYSGQPRICCNKILGVSAFA